MQNYRFDFMPIQFSKYFLVVVFLLSSNFVKANIDSTKNNFLFEINIESLLSRSLDDNGPNLFNAGQTYGCGLNLGYQIRQTHRLKLGLAMHQLCLLYTIETGTSRPSGPSGPSSNNLVFKEEIWMKSLSSGIMYSKDFTHRFSIDLEAFLYFKIFNESRKREGLIVPPSASEGLTVFGIYHGTKNNFIRLNSRFNFKVASDVSVGLSLGLRTEKVTIPVILGNSHLNFLYGLSLTYRV